MMNQTSDGNLKSEISGFEGAIVVVLESTIQARTER